MATFGTVEVYEEMARVLNEDPHWLEIGKNITSSFIYNYREPVGKSFFLRFEGGRVTDVKEIDGPDAEQADFGLTADPDIWRGLLTKQIKPTSAVTTGKVKVKGNIMAMMKEMKAYTYILEAMTKVELA